MYASLWRAIAAQYFSTKLSAFEIGTGFETVEVYMYVCVCVCVYIYI